MEKIVRLFNNPDDALIGMTILKDFSIDQIIKFIEKFPTAESKFQSNALKVFKVKYSGHLNTKLNTFIGFQKDNFILVLDSSVIALCENDSEYLRIYKKHITWI